MTVKPLRNFLSRSPRFRWASIRRYCKAAWVYVWPVLVGLVIIFGIPAALYGPHLRHAYDQAQQGKENLLRAKTLLTQQEFELGIEKLDAGKQNLVTAQAELGKLGVLRSLPYVKVQLKATDNLVAAGIAATNGITRLSTWAETVIAPFKTSKAFSLGHLAPDQKRVILKAIFQAQPDLQAAQASINLAVTDLDAIPTSGLIGPINAAVKPFRDLIPSLQSGIAQAIPASKIIPPLLGYPNQQNYLFLLQNNTELRPTGGFIGTYGILKVKNGEISSFSTDNVYNLDGKATSLNVTPPTPLTQYNKVNRWFLRDSNWSPDFTVAAQTALNFYRRENGPERNINGVIAVDPTFFQQLMQLTGPITLGKQTYTSENFVDELQLVTGYAYVGRPTIDTSQRKLVIGDLGRELIKRVMELPKDKYGKAWTIFQQAVEQKHLLLWLADSEEQGIAEQLDWAGVLARPQGDDLAVVDANMASLKSDPYVKRTIQYSVTADADGLLATVKIHYQNTATLTWKTTRYRSYTRVYVPLGSTLVKSSGAMVECNVKRDGKTTTGEELGHTVFAAFTCTELGASHDLSFTYRLGGSAAALYQQNAYKLTIQKQGGTAAHTLEVTLDLGKHLTYDGTLPTTAKLKGTTFTDSTTLTRDQSYAFTF